MLKCCQQMISSARMVPVWLLWLGRKNQDVLLDNSYIRLENRKMPRAASARGLMLLLSLKEDKCEQLLPFAHTLWV